MSAADFDVLVIGAGACGLAAAIAAHDAGVRVGLAEKLDRPGGNSSLSTGSVPGAGTRFQRQAGIRDSAQTMFDDLKSIAGEMDDLDLLRRMTAVSAQTVEWLVDTVGVQLELITDYRHIGHSVPRLHAPVSRRGQDLVDDLLAAAAQRSIPLAVGNAAVDLIVSDGAVSGAVIDSGRGLDELVARKTILAVNGFAGNRDLVARYCPEISTAAYFGALGSTGEAITWGERVGAAFANMGAYQGYAAVAYPHGSLLSWTTIEKGGVLLGADGRRFADESLGYSGLTPIVLAQGDPVYAVFDEKIFSVAAREEEFVELWRHGGIKKAPTVAAAAVMLGIDPQAIAATIGHYNEAATGHCKDALGRRDFGLGPLEAPVYVVRVVPGLFHTQGGLRIDSDARVLRSDGNAVPNLFAGGGAAAGISGRSGAMGYASGNGLLSALALGRLAGLAAAEEVR